MLNDADDFNAFAATVRRRLTKAERQVRALKEMLEIAENLEDVWDKKSKESGPQEESPHALDTAQRAIIHRSLL